MPAGEIRLGERVSPDFAPRADDGPISSDGGAAAQSRSAGVAVADGGVTVAAVVSGGVAAAVRRASDRNYLKTRRRKNRASRAVSG